MNGDIVSPQSLLRFIDIAGTIAFAVSGAMAGIKKELDLFGILILALLTATGGGIIRDILVGHLPPASLINPVYFITALISGLLVFFFYRQIDHLKKSFLFFDALGLGLFTIMGLRTGMAEGLNPLSILFLGTLTGIGGGILRDSLSGEIPLVFRRELYASISLAVGLIYWLLTPLLPETPLAYGAILLIVLLRLGSLRLNWHLPTRKDLP